MSIGLLILSHDGCASQLLRQIDSQQDELAFNCMALMINQEMTGEVLLPHLEQRLEQLDTGNGVLLLVDTARPALIEAVTGLARRHLLKVLTGLNLPMLQQVLAHPDADLDSLAGFALQGGRQGIQILATPLPE
ncbi:MAG: PTS sugar transporter subunit IIA [Pseudomonadota bacterium]